MQRFRNKTMRYIDFHQVFSSLGCFDTNQVKLVQPDFDRTALNRWVAKGYLIQLKNGIYAFRHWATQPNADLVAANRIYRPSYISTYTALAHYGMIPEFVAQTTSVSTLKTTAFSNELGKFEYRHIKPDLFFGYHIIASTTLRDILIATPEKALIDLLYLSPVLKTEQDMLELRLDEDYMGEEFDYNRALAILQRIGNKALSHRFTLIEKTYR